MTSAKWLDLLVFSDKYDKPEVPSHNTSMFITLWDVKEPTHQSKSVGHGVPGVLVLSGLWGGGWGIGEAPRMDL